MITFINMNALDVISLADAKEFLVVDFPDKDTEITRHIKSAVSIVERYTCYNLYQRDIVYQIGRCGRTEVYDYPVAFPNGTVTEARVLSVILKGSANSTVNATTGYTDVTQIPENLIDACYKLITYLFENKDVYEANLPGDVQLMINQFRRSATIL
jgi:hypothetical protein